MTEKDIRLRLVVRRDGFPEVRLIWNVSLESDPTISKLLEKVNETIPLEIEQKGLENYVVELRDDDGTNFECLHFQTVRSVLKPDDRVFIRALDRDDNKQRRISGRYRISSDGRHLIDGIPFGRRRLKVSSSQPPVAQPPRKRARLAYNQEDLDEDDDDDDFLGEEDTPMLLLTNGEQDSSMVDSSSVRINAEFDDADADADAEDGDLDSEAEIDDTHNRPEPEDSEQDQSESSSDEDMEDELDDEDLGDELQDLMKDNVDYAEEEDPEEQDGQGSGESEAESSDLGTSDETHIDKISALRAAFPSAPAALCEKLLSSSNGELKTAYSGLVDIYEPKLSKSAVLKWRPSGEQGSSKTSTARGGAPLDATSSQSTKENHDTINDDEDDWESAEDEEEDEQEVPDFVRQFDHRGLPPGSITSGKGLVQMAAVSGSHTNNKSNGESETTSATLNESKASPEKTLDEDNTSSDDASSVSEDEDSESGSDDHSEDDDEGSSDDNNSEGSDSHDSENDSDGNSVDLEGRDSPASDDDVSSGLNSGSDNSSENDSENNSDEDSEEDSEDSEDSEDNDSGPEESSTKLPLSIQKGSGSEDDSNQDTSSSESSSDSEISSSEDSSEAESSSEFESEQVEKYLLLSHKDTEKLKITKELPKSAQQSQLPPPITKQVVQAQPVPVPPGAGKEGTRKRNARRRAAKKAKMQAQQAQQAASTTGALSISKEGKPPAPVLDDKALFEAKRQELLNAIANGGVEVGPPNQQDNPSKTSNVAKRKRQEQDGLDQQVTQEATPARTPASADNQTSASAQKKRRIDVGAGRRMLFGALGLRNPQSKEDEEKLRANIMKDVRPLENPRLKEGQMSAQQAIEGEGEPTEAEPDGWKNKIICRAVECCQEGVVLSEPPFPFVQRWDPQQQGYWSHKKNKRGGQSKRAQRNEAHFYQDSHSNKKRKHDESAMWDEEGYDDTFNGIDDNTNADIELNYDDPEDDQTGGTNGPTNDASQFTDMDDLPSLPSDLSTLPDLRPGEVQLGMVITWQQWSCSSATGWQPQLSNVTGVVVRVDDDATGVGVCLARRDRYLDRNEKKYDQNGRRIYDRFEAPDLDEEEDDDDDEDFRTIGFAEMQQPKILQQPLPAMTANEDRNMHNDKLPAENSVPAKSPTTAKDMQLDASEQPDLVKPTKNNAPAVENPETSQHEQKQQASDGSESGQSGISSPSRQLHESTSQAIGEISRDRSTQDPSSVVDSGLNTTSGKSNSNMSGSGIPSARQSSVPLFDSHESEVLIGTPKKVKTKPVVPPSSASSARSGRQPDYSMDTNETQPDSLKITDDGVSAAANSEGLCGPESDEDVSTPTPKPNRQSEPINLKQEGASKNGPHSSPENPSTPSSLSSINTVWNTARSALSARNTQTPFSQSQSQPIASQASEKARARKDKEYEEAMRKLDDFSDDLDSVSRIPDSFKRSSQASGPNGKIRSKSPQIKISPPPTRKRRSTKPPVQFTLPPGTQVVDISSDSEPAYAENYADDEVDGTYSPEPDSFPRGNGWVNKRVEAMNRKPRNISAPVGSRVGSQPTKKEMISSSQSYQPSLPMSSISNPSRLKSRKTSSRF